MRIRRLVSLLTITLTLISSSFIVASPQDKKKPDQDTVKLSAELVQIDVLVTDKNNKPVSGLKREDFELSDNGKPQEITSFAYEEAKNMRMEENKDAARAKTLPRAITAGELHRVVAFVVDTLHMNISSVHRTRKMLADFVENKMEPGDLVLILPTGGGSGILQQFTADRRILSRAISRLRPFYFSNSVTPYRSLERRSPSTNRAGEPRINAVPGALSMPDTGINTSGNVDPLEEADVRDTLRTLKDLIKSMSRLPGRKVSVFVSQGFRVYHTQATSDLKETTALAARSNVVFYSIDPNGLDPVFSGADEAIVADENLPLSVAVAVASNQRVVNLAEARDSLDIISSETGGKFFRNNNDIITGLGNLLSENSAYYMLGFQPQPGRWDGKFHKIKVTLKNRPDLTVSSRKGYVAKNDESDDHISDPKIAEAAEAISSPFVRRDIDLKLTPFYIDNGQRDAVVTILLHIDASKLNFKKTDDRYQAVLDQVGTVLDANKNPVDQFANQLNLDLKPQTYEAALKRGFVATRRISLKPGTYQVKLFVRQSESGLIGTANDYFDVPDMAGDNLAVSSIFTSGQGGEQGKAGDSAGQGSTLSNRQFQRNGQLAYSFVIYNARTEGKNTQPDLEMKIRVLKGAKAVFTGTPRPVQMGEGSAPPSRIVTGGALQLGALDPGDYTLEVIVTDKARKKDGSSAVRQQIDFSVD